ncbi:MAG: hypothetical protein K5Q68_12115 [Roseococcus sp.]|nr:hypothetical protein [Roseococcus sp.]
MRQPREVAHQDQRIAGQHTLPRRAPTPWQEPRRQRRDQQRKARAIRPIFIREAKASPKGGAQRHGAAQAAEPCRIRPGYGFEMQLRRDRPGLPQPQRAIGAGQGLRGGIGMDHPQRCIHDDGADREGLQRGRAQFLARCRHTACEAQLDADGMVQMRHRPAQDVALNLAKRLRAFRAMEAERHDAVRAQRIGRGHQVVQAQLPREILVEFAAPIGVERQEFMTQRHVRNKAFRHLREGVAEGADPRVFRVEVTGVISPCFVRHALGVENLHPTRRRITKPERGRARADRLLQPIADLLP